jgi:uncharacterized membrane protein YfcA
LSLALIPVFLALGAFVGFLAGLLGIGGGFTIVPVLVEVFGWQGVSTAHLLPLAIGTSAATIMFTSFSSARAHHLRGAVDWTIVRALAPGLVIGSIVGAQVASALPMRIMAAVFGSFTWYTAWQLVRTRAPHPTGVLPGRGALFGVGSSIGLVAGMVGTGGAFLAVPYLTRRSVSMHSAVATSAAIGWPVAVAATASYVFAGLRQPDLPPHTIGYVYLPALLVVALASMALAPLGAKVAHAWPVGRLRRAFAAMLFLLGAWMWVKALA